MKKYLMVSSRQRQAFPPTLQISQDVFRRAGPMKKVEHNMREAIALHLDGLREEGQAVPEPHTYSAYVELPA